MIGDESQATVDHPSAAPALWEIEWRVRQVVAEQCNLKFESLNSDTRLVEDLGIDSLEIVEVFLGLEEEFGLSISDQRAQEVFTKAPVRLRGLALLVQQCWSIEPVPRENWRRVRPALPPPEEVPFTQLGPAADRTHYRPLYEPLGLNRAGCAEYRRRTDGMRCVLIPAGMPWLGMDTIDAPSDQKPQHTVQISAFVFDAEPVSNAAYSRFLNSIGDLPLSILEGWCGVGAGDKREAQYALRSGRRGWTPVPGAERQPMILVSWWGANAYSLWAHQLDWRAYRSDDSSPRQTVSCQLPSEAQWEYVARGAADWLAPPDGLSGAATACVARHTAGTDYDATTLPAAPVSARLGMSPFGVHHMAGNIWQWCSDWYAPDYYQQPAALSDNPHNAEPTGIRSERGGSWVGPAELAAPWYRRGRPPEARGRCLGFRCAGADTGLLPNKN